MQIENVPITKITPYARNAKKHPKDQIEKIALQISSVGFLVPIIVDKNFLIIAGHGRFAAAKSLALETVPVIVADHLSEAQATAFRIADNKVAESEWDLPLLGFEIGSLDRLNFDLNLTAIPMDEIKVLLDELKEKEASESGSSSKAEEEAPPPPRISRVKKGDLWHVGRHILLCGDSTDIEDVKFLIGGAVPTFLFTDPPYGVNAVQKDGKIGWSGKADAKDYPVVIGDEDTQTARKFYDIVKTLGIKKQFIWGGNYFTDFLPPTPCWIIWDKGRGEGTKFAEGEIAWTNLTTPIKFIRHVWNGFIKESERGENRVHPTQKPAFLAEWALTAYGDAKEVILDLFGGSGSTLIAAEKLGHTAFLMELENVYCDVILERFARVTGNDPIRADGMAWSKLKIAEVE